MGYSRRRTGGEGQRATPLELFYDLVFVFAITQVSHLLLEHLTWAGVGQSLLVLLVVWWSWNYTTWVTNELDTDSVSVRLLLISLMLLSLLMSVAIPEAFGDRALLFAGSYVAIQVGRHIFLTFFASGPGTVERERAGRILIWFVAFGLAFLATAAMWWLYFVYVARIAQRRLELAPNRTELARDGYTYLHVLMAAGIIVSAVGDELVIAHPTEVLPAPEIAVVVAGPGLYLLAHAFFRRRMTGAWGRKRLFGALGCFAVGAAGPFVPGIVLSGLVLAVLATVIVSEYLSGVRRARRGEPTPLER